MALQLAANGFDIETLTGDAGTYTWADVVALGSTNLTSNTDTNGVTYYRWKGTITVGSTATLNILGINLELLGVSTSQPGCIRATGSGTVNFGESVTVGSNIVYKNGCQLTISRLFYNSANNGVLYAALSYDTSSRSSTGAKINLYATQIRARPDLVAAGIKRLDLFVSRIINTTIESVDPAILTGAADAKGTFAYLQPSGTMADSTIIYAATEFVTTATLSGVNRIYQPYTGIVAFSALDITAAIIDSTYDYFSAKNSGIKVVNSPLVDLTKGLIYWVNAATVEATKIYTHDLKITDGGGNVNNAFVVYTGYSNLNNTSAPDGSVGRFRLVSERTNLGSGYYTGGGDYLSFFPTPIPTVSTSSYTRQIRSYLHQEEAETLTIDSQIGSTTLPSTIKLAVDAGITQTNTTTVGAYTGITNASALITLSGSLSLAQVYDSRKLYWRNTDSITAPFRSGQLADFGNTNLTIASGGVLNASTAKFSDGFKSNGTITLLSPSSLTTTFQTDSGTVALQAGGDYRPIAATVGATATITVAADTDISTWELAAGATINRSGTGTRLVTVKTLTGIAAGTDVTLQTPVTTITISGIPTGANAILGVIDLTTMAQTFPTITGGTATIPVNPARSYFIACDARGYLRETVTLAGNVPSYTFNLTNFRSLYDAGVSRSSDISFNTSTFEVMIGSGTANLSLADVFHTIEDYLATPEAVFFSTPPYPQIVSTGSGTARQYLIFPYDAVAGTPNPVRIKPKTTNTSDPTLTDFVIVHEGSTAPLFTIFDFTGASGRTIRFQTEAVAASVTVSGSGALTTEQSAQLTALSATLSDSGVFSTGALVNTKGVIGLATANLDTQLTGINTNIDQIPLTDYSEDITTIKDKVNPLTYTVTNQVDSNPINRTGFNLSSAGIQAIWNALVSSFTADGTIGKYIVDYLDGIVGLAAGSNLIVTAIQERTNQLSFTDGKVDAQINNLPAIPNNWITAAGIATDAIDADALATSAVTEIQSGLSTYSGGDTAGTTTLLSRLSVARSGYLDNLTNLDASVSARPTLTQIEDSTVLFKTSQYTAPANSVILSAIGNIPTVVYTSTLSSILSSVNGIPNTPLLVGDSRLNFLDASIAAIPTTKTGYSLTGGERTAIATAVETQLTSEFEALPTATEIREEMDANSKLVAIDTNAQIARQGVTNRYKIDEDANTGTLYADDGTTPIAVQNLLDKDGNPASTQTYERVPQ
ncbi:MAG: hypothetical protein KME42_14220 [Tildeniella nuda ZEHNDER 1965/U140]|jgi:hypothetical protein|nr:hypothetical protein [Tildeniella nuda ZEHNDER 1965/U140]